MKPHFYLVPALTRLFYSSRTRSITTLQPYLPAVSHFHTTPRPHQMELREAVKVLEKVAPSWQAESWDNVGLLVEPASKQHISRLIITNDLTEEVLDEMMKCWEPLDQCLVVSYHPPIFKPLKRLTQGSSSERVVLKALAAGMAVYSPHTALDNKAGGMTDWLLSGLGEGEVLALGVNKHAVPLSSSVEVRGLRERDKEELVKVLAPYCKLDDIKESAVGLLTPCKDKDLGPILSLLKEAYPDSTVSLTSSPEVLPSLSGGKLLTLKEPSPLSEITRRVKAHLDLPFIRLARPQFQGEDPVIRTIAGCPGSGGSVLEKVRADLLLTGEMSHHQVLAATGRSVAVILCDHSNTERGFLQKNYQKELEQAFAGSLDIVIAKTDKDPLEIV